MSNRELGGIIVPVITPIDKKENVDERAFRKILRRVIGAGVSGIFVGGSCGEGPLLVAAQWRRMVEIACDEVGDRLPLLGGVSDTSTRRVREKIATLRSIGYRYFVATSTYYIATKTPTEHLRLFGEAKKAAGKMEMIAYNIPQCTGSVLSIDAVCEMARRGWIRYCKESSGDLRYLKNLIRRGKAVGLDVLVGDELIMDRGMLAGGKGIVPACANYVPEKYVRFYKTIRCGDRNAMTEQMRELLRIREILLLSGACWISGMKYAMSLLGFGSGMCLSPLEPAEPERRTLIEALVKENRQERRNPRTIVSRETVTARRKSIKRLKRSA
jgi:4-hydroxy-tetrahydrodipicolinate synthase